MSPSGFRPTRRALFVLLAIGTIAGIAALAIWRGYRSLPAPGSAVYEDVTRSFYKGLAELQVGLLDDAASDFAQATSLVPAEPSSWANLAIARLRLGDVDTAAEPVTRARTLAPGNADIAMLGARLEAARGQIDQTIAELRRAVSLDPRHIRARVALAEELERAGSDDAATEALMLLDEVQRLAPTNLAVVLERARLAATRADETRLRDSLTRLEKMEASFPTPAQEQYQALRRAIEGRQFADAARGTAMLRNVLARVPSYSADLVAIRTPPEVVAEPFESFLALANPASVPAPADETLAYTADPLGEGETVAVAAFSLNGSDAPVVFTANRTTIRRVDTPGVTWTFPGGTDQGGTLLPIDWNNDFKIDLFAAAAGGVRLMLQGEGGQFNDATAVAGARSPVTCGCIGAWSADIEMDGDLDVVLGIANGATMVLRNNGDGTWDTADVFAGVPDLRAFSWADLDRDGDPDAVLLSGDRVRVYLNNRAGSFVERAGPSGLANTIALTVADVNGDGTFDIVGRAGSGGIRRASLDADGEWTQRDVIGEPPTPAETLTRTTLFAADLDNNGTVDLVSGGSVALAGDRHDFRWIPARAPNAVTAPADFDGDGLLDLLSVGSAAARLHARGAKRYHWKQVRVRAQQAAGDQRINPFAVGGEIEVRSGLLRQKQLLTGAPAHFGLGTRTAIDVARIVWPNGVPQAEFGVKVDDTIVAEQRLKGSCPWVFAFDGQDVRFVTDFLWRSPLGLRINAQDTAASQTEDWVRIGGDQLAARDGMYDIRITAELWETHFFDHVSLLAIDHPAETDAYIDERFSPQPAAFSVQVLRDMRPVTSARDRNGRDVTDLVARRDGRFLAAFDRGRYQGIAADHVVELEIEPQSPIQSKGRVLVAHGWVYPTDSSINVAIAQGRHVQPRGLSLEFQRPDGTWAVAEPALGFPAGKNKTMLVDLSRTANATRLRLRTNLEVSWDLLAVAASADSTARTTRIPIAEADLRYRGFSRTVSPRGNAPETPIYSPVAATGQRWRDLRGYYTRFGDVRELLAAVDDRYVIMNAGDELVLRFASLAPPPSGWRRDFVLVGDGWEKDGDFNTEFSATVLPLPAHGARPYDPAAPASHLEDDPIFLRHRADWERYHTRYVSPSAFASGLAARESLRFTGER